MAKELFRVRRSGLAARQGFRAAAGRAAQIGQRAGVRTFGPQPGARLGAQRAGEQVIRAQTLGTLSLQNERARTAQAAEATRLRAAGAAADRGLRREQTRTAGDLAQQNLELRRGEAATAKERDQLLDRLSERRQTEAERATGVGETLAGRQQTERERATGVGEGLATEAFGEQLRATGVGEGLDVRQQTERERAARTQEGLVKSGQAQGAEQFEARQTQGESEFARSLALSAERLGLDLSRFENDKDREEKIFEANREVRDQAFAAARRLPEEERAAAISQSKRDFLENQPVYKKEGILGDRDDRLQKDLKSGDLPDVLASSDRFVDALNSVQGAAVDRRDQFRAILRSEPLTDFGSAADFLEIGVFASDKEEALLQAWNRAVSQAGPDDTAELNRALIEIIKSK